MWWAQVEWSGGIMNSWARMTLVRVWGLALVLTEISQHKLYDCCCRCCCWSYCCKLSCCRSFNASVNCVCLSASLPSLCLPRAFVRLVSRSPSLSPYGPSQQTSTPSLPANQPSGPTIENQSAFAWFVFLLLILLLSLLLVASFDQLNNFFSL